MATENKAQPAPTKRPLIRTSPVSEFGEFDAEVLEAGAPNGRVMDPTYVPGWSELRYQRDLEMAEVVHGVRAAGDVKPLPGNVRLVRRSTAGGSFDGRKLMASANNGYRPITKADVGEDWFTELPAGAKVLEDGSIVNAAGDMQYMFCTAQRAAANLRTKTQRMLDMAAVAGQAVKGGAVEAGGTFGKEPL